VKDKGILFKAPMVRGILDDKKDMTRRLVQLPLKDPDTGCEIAGCEAKSILSHLPALCPYGPVGRKLWVKETWRAHEHADGTDGILYAADGTFIPIENTREAAERWVAARREGKKPGAFRPSIFMPRWASRITLEVTGVRVERLQEISAEDAIAEGIPVSKGVGAIDGETCYGMTTNSGYMRGRQGAIVAFQDLWQSINGPGSWEANPYVWVIQFRRIQP